MEGPFLLRGPWGTCPDCPYDRSGHGDRCIWCTMKTMRRTPTHGLTYCWNIYYLTTFLSVQPSSGICLHQDLRRVQDRPLGFNKHSSSKWDRMFLISLKYICTSEHESNLKYESGPHEQPVLFVPLLVHGLDGLFGHVQTIWHYSEEEYCRGNIVILFWPG